MSSQDYMLPPSLYTMSNNEVIHQPGNMNNMNMSQMPHPPNVVSILGNNNGNINANAMSRQPKPPNNNGPSHNVVHTPLGTLNELCSKAKVTPVFNFTADGPVHNRIFECHVSVNKDGMGTEAKAVGVGKNKKDAKHDAAKKLLLSMDARLVENFDPRFNQREEIPKPIECDPDPPGNPVGELNELCLRAKKVIPEYGEESQEGAPHERVFTVTCRLGSKMFECGRGRSKKQAKKVAAYKMLQRIMVLMRNRENEDPQNVDEFDASLDEKFQNMSFNIPRKNKGNKKLNDIIKEFRARTGEKLDVIHNDNQAMLRSLDPLKLLKSITEEQKLSVDWLDFQRNQEDTLAHCLLSIGSEPMLMFMGSGESTKQSKKNAAEQALKFLRLATSK